MMIRMILVPVLTASLLASLGAIFHSLRSDVGTWRFLEEEQFQHQEPSPENFKSIHSPKHARRQQSQQQGSGSSYSQRDVLTFTSFPIVGVNLARFNLNYLDGADDNVDKNSIMESSPSSPSTTSVFELYSDFDLSAQIIGNETWRELLRYRRDATHPTLSFYVDKVARKRYFQYHRTVDTPRSFLLLYRDEIHQQILTTKNNKNSVADVTLSDERKSISKLIPGSGQDYVAKSSHLSCAGGVWLIKTIRRDRNDDPHTPQSTPTMYFGRGKKKLEVADEGFLPQHVIAKDLANNLHKVQDYCGSRVKESIALVNVQPGILIEERFTSPWEGEDETGGIEFKVFTIWGRMWLAVWRPGMDGAQAFLHRDGSNLEWGGKNVPLPDWIDWQRIVDIAERLGAHKDMFRTDIFVGVPSDSPALRQGTSQEERLAAVRYVVSENEIHPTEYFHVRNTTEILEEGARLWLAGYQMLKDRIRIIPNDEVPKEFVEKGMLPSIVKVPAFKVAGIDLAQYENDGHSSGAEQSPSEEPFQLFKDFDLSEHLVGNETWVDLLRYRRDAKWPGLAFYVDKIARRRWLASHGFDVPTPYFLKYATELATSTTDDPTNEILGLLPRDKDFCAKPTHLSCSGGVWLTKKVGNTTYIGNGKALMQEDQKFSNYNIARDLADNLKRVMKICGSKNKESIALQTVKAGIMAEERFTAWEGADDRGGMEFKVHTIWGRVWLVYWRAGTDGVQSFFNRDGSHLLWEGKNEPLPDWIDWGKLISIAERLGSNKDMFRTDIFVGVPSNSPALRKNATVEERLACVRYVVSETEIHPTPIRGTERVFDEGGRLWLAGYKIGNYKIIEDSEVPAEFLETGRISEKQMDGSNSIQAQE